MLRAALLQLIALAAPALRAQSPDPRSARVDSLFAAMDRTNLPGCAVGVVQNGRFLYRRGYGMADLERGVPNTSETVFYMGSVSKQFTAMSIALLVRDGKLSLDDSARKYVPELPPAAAGITIRHMLHHMSGLREKWDLFLLRGLREGDLVNQQDVLDLVAAQRELNFVPGSEHLYNNTAYDLLATIAQRVSGKPIREFARERIFSPLGMSRSQYVDDWTLLVPGRAAGHSVANGQVSLLAAHVETVGSGSVYSTVEDMARWDESFYTGQLGGPELLQLVQTPGKLNDGTQLIYAFGLFVDTWRGLRRVHHGGALAGFRTEIMRFPDQHFSAIVLCNLAQVNPQSYAERIAEIYLADLLGPAAAPVAAKAEGAKPPQPPLARTAWDTYAGTYRSPELGVSWTLAVHDTSLVATMARGREGRLQPVSYDRFGFEGMTVGFGRDKKGRITELRISTGRSRNIQFVKQ